MMLFLKVQGVLTWCQAAQLTLGVEAVPWYAAEVAS